MALQSRKNQRSIGESGETKICSQPSSITGVNKTTRISEQQATGGCSVRAQVLHQNAIITITMVSFSVRTNFCIHLTIQP